MGSHGWLGLEMKIGHSHKGQTWGRGRLPTSTDGDSADLLPFVGVHMDQG